VSYGELERLFEQFFALVEATVRLPPGLERRTAFRDVRDYGARRSDRHTNPKARSALRTAPGRVGHESLTSGSNFLP
jgi:hypothetical protein